MARLVTITSMLAAGSDSGGSRIVHYDVTAPVTNGGGMGHVRASWRALRWVAAGLAIAAADSTTTLVARPASAAEQVGQATQPRTIAVLPFDNISGQPDDDWLGVGIAETISADLQRLGTVSSFDADDGLPLEVARDRGFSWVVTGGYQHVGDQLRITVRILDVETAATQGVARVDGAASDLFSLQDQIVSQLLNSLEPLLLSTPDTGAGARPTEGIQLPPQPPPDAPSIDPPPGGGRPGGLAPPAAPQAPPSGPTASVGAGLDVAVGVGVAIPVSPDGFSELFDTGFSFSVDASRQIRGLLGWRAEFGYDRTSLAGVDLNIDFARYAGGITVAPFDTADPGMPYGFFTVGGFTTDARGGDAPEVDAETDIGISLGGGYKWQVDDRWGIGGNLRLNGVFGGSGDLGGNDDAPVWYLTPSVVVIVSF